MLEAKNTQEYVPEAHPTFDSRIFQIEKIVRKVDKDHYLVQLKGKDEPEKVKYTALRPFNKSIESELEKEFRLGIGENSSEPKVGKINPKSTKKRKRK